MSLVTLCHSLGQGNSLSSLQESPYILNTLSSLQERSYFHVPLLAFNLISPTFHLQQGLCLWWADLSCLLWFLSFLYSCQNHPCPRRQEPPSPRYTHSFASNSSMSRSFFLRFLSILEGSEAVGCLPGALDFVPFETWLFDAEEG